MQSEIYELPFGPHGRWLKSGAGRWLLGDWQFTGILSAYSGLPINFTFSAATLNAPGNNNRPNVSGRPEKIGGIGGGQKYFDTSKFSAPASAAFGNVGRNILSGPGYLNLDLAVFRRFSITERVQGEFRVEAFKRMIRFLHQFETGRGDYSVERHQWLDSLTIEDIAKATAKSDDNFKKTK